MTDTRSCVELAIPAMLCLIVANGTNFSCYDSLGNVTDTAGHLQLVEIRAMLDKASEEALAPLNAYQRATARRYVHRAARAALEPLYDQPASKVMRAILWFIASEIDAGHIELYAGSKADLAITKLMEWTEDTFDTLPDEGARRLDASAMKNARRIGETLRAMGYYKA